jgi:hypothetical protein
MKLRFAFRITELILDYGLSCRCQVVGNLEFFGGILLSTILPAWLTTILIWDRRRVLSSSMRGDRAELPPAMLAGNSRSANFRLLTRVTVSKKGHFEQS